MCDVAVRATGSMTVQEYETASWPAYSTASSLGAMPPHSSTKWMGLRGRVYLGMFASGTGEGVFSVKGRRVFVALGGGVVKESEAGQTGKGRVIMAEGKVS